jgi:hypothetical protein
LLVSNSPDDLPAARPFATHDLVVAIPEGLPADLVERRELASAKAPAL